MAKITYIAPKGKGTLYVGGKRIESGKSAEFTTAEWEAVKGTGAVPAMLKSGELKASGATAPAKSEAKG